jgi:hypothetical protein
MGTTNNRVTYGLCILAASAIFLAWISHSGRKPVAPKDAPIPWKGEAPSQASALSPKVVSSTETSGSSGVTDAGQSTAQTYARPVSQTPRPPDDASSASSSSLPSSFTTPSLDEEPSAADSDQSSAQPQETAAQRVARQLRRR